VGRMLAMKFAGRYVQFGLVPGGGQMHRKALKVFGVANAERTEFRFHINQLSEFHKLLIQTGYDNPKLYHKVEVPVKSTPEVEFTVDSKYVPRDYQVPIVEYITKKDPKCKLVGLQTGGGKSLVAMLGISKLKKIPCIIVKPAYIEKWTEDLIKTYNLTVEDIMVVQGGKHLMALLTLMKEKKLEYKAVILSNRTMQIWLSAYERNKEETMELGYCIHPHEFFEHIGAGVRLIDEVHQDFHFNFKLDLYTNVEYAISLSATLITNDPFLRNMHEVAYPLKDRYVSPPLKKYVNSFAIHYRFDKPDRIRTSEYGSNNYSHNAVEASILNNKETTYAYLNLIDYVLSIGYLKSKKKDKRCIIFAYSVEMCTKVKEFLEGKYPEYDVRRYVGPDPYENLMQAEIIVSTLGSSGTAIDIPSLTNVVLTTAVDSIQSNVQSLGRLRELDNGNTPTEFHYFVCEDIPKHLEYHQRKKEMLSQRAKSFIDVYSGHVL
jgi:superfamily II DNA or RNA helicase